MSGWFHSPEETWGFGSRSEAPTVPGWRCRQGQTRAGSQLKALAGSGGNKWLPALPPVYFMLFWRSSPSSFQLCETLVSAMTTGPSGEGEGGARPGPGPGSALPSSACVFGSSGPGEQIGHRALVSQQLQSSRHSSGDLSRMPR